MSKVERPENNRFVKGELREELPTEMVEAFLRLGIEKEKIRFLGLMRNRTYRVEVAGDEGTKSFVYKEISAEHGRTIIDIIQDQNASRILEQLGYPARKLLVLEPNINPKCAIFNLIPGERGGVNQNELLIPERVLLIAKDLRSTHQATETDFYNQSTVAIPEKDSEVSYQDFCIGYAINDIGRLDIPNREQISALIKESAGHLARGKFSFIHGDINQFNIVWKNPERPILIDWGYSEFGDFTRDIANLLLHLHKDRRGDFEAVLASILQQYGDRSEQINRNLKFYLGLRYLTYGRVGLVRAGDPTALKKIEQGYSLLKEFIEEST